MASNGQRAQFLLIYKQASKEKLRALEATVCEHFQALGKPAKVTSFIRASDAQALALVEC